ncbi:uncharacterized protein [Montipora foliosa]|uniref:uncharacterized protein isoform X3 n=1 Tax=Montipora foliosa TaxID=591990 RepID=UPI0035F1998D
MENCRSTVQTEMHRLFLQLAFGITFLSISCYSQATDVESLSQQIQALTDRIDAAHIECIGKMTSFAPASDAPIMFLDRQNVDCPESHLLAQFHLVREESYVDSSGVRYNYRCCRLVL